MRCLRRVRDPDGTNPLRSHAAVPISIGATPSQISIRDPKSYAADRAGTWSHAPFSLESETHQARLSFPIYERYAPRVPAPLIPKKLENSNPPMRLLSRTSADPSSFGS